MNAMDDAPRPIVTVKQFTTAVLEPSKMLSPSTEAWSQAALDAGNRADRDPEYAKDIGKRLF